MKFCSFAACICLALCAAAFAQQPLTNDSIEKMANAGLGDAVILSLIQNQPGNYNVSADSLIALKQEGVSDNVLAAMAAKTSAPTSLTPIVASSAYEDLDIGVYRKVRDAWVLVQAEQVNWKTGGVLKSIATDGIIKGDVNGRLQGGTSGTQMANPLQFIIRTPDGVEATDFQLVHLHKKSNAREFRTVTGGVFHASGGSSRDAVEFSQVRVARQTYKVTFPSYLPAGEYAFLAPGLTGSSASGSTGKAYTFSLME